MFALSANICCGTMVLVDSNTFLNGINNYICIFVEFCVISKNNILIIFVSTTPIYLQSVFSRLACSLFIAYKFFKAR